MRNLFDFITRYFNPVIIAELFVVIGAIQKFLELINELDDNNQDDQNGAAVRNISK